MKKEISLFANILAILGVMIFSDLSHAESNKTAKGAIVDSLGPRYESTLEEGVQFAKEGYPSFLQSVSGLSLVESFGRWTDGKEVVFRFKKKLPKKFTLELTAYAFGPNINSPLTVMAGGIVKKINITSDLPKAYMVEFTEVNSDILKLLPAKPTTPKSMGINEDTRTLGVALIGLKIKH